MRKTEDNSGGLDVRTVVPIGEICAPCINGVKVGAGAESAKKFSSIGRTSAG